MRLLKPVVTGALVLGAFGIISLPSPAHAAATCASLGAGSPVRTGSGGLLSGPPPRVRTNAFDDVTLAVGDVVTTRVTNNTIANAKVRMVWTDSSGNIIGDSGEKTMPINATETLTFTATTANTLILQLVGQGDSNNSYPSFTSLSCAPAGGTGGASQETTSKAVTSAVSRSQTSVIQQNIGARVTTVVGSAGAGSVGAGGAGGAGGGAGGAGNDNDGNSFTQAGFTDQFSAFNDADRDTRDVMRQLAMRSSFDSSILAADMARDNALALGPTDQGNSGGASGIDGRSALVNASPITVWGHGAYTAVDNDYNNGTQDNRYDGDVWGYNLGADYRFDNNVIAGLSLGYNDTDLTTTFNNGTYE